MTTLIQTATTQPELIQLREKIERHAAIHERQVVVHDYLILYHNTRLYTGQLNESKQERIEFCQYFAEQVKLDKI